MPKLKDKHVPLSLHEFHVHADAIATTKPRESCDLPDLVMGRIVDECDQATLVTLVTASTTLRSYVEPMLWRHLDVRPWRREYDVDGDAPSSKRLAYEGYTRGMQVDELTGVGLLLQGALEYLGDGLHNHPKRVDYVKELTVDCRQTDAKFADDAYAVDKLNIHVQGDFFAKADFGPWSHLGDGTAGEDRPISAHPCSKESFPPKSFLLPPAVDITRLQISECWDGYVDSVLRLVSNTRHHII